MPNRRRRKLSTAMSAVAALAVVSPFAVTAITDLTEPAPQPREFRQAAMITDLPSELMSALTQGLSQFGINLPPMPTSLLTGSDASAMPTTLTAPGGLGAAPLTAPGGLGAAPLTAPGGLGTAPLTTPGLVTDPAAAVPALGDASLANPALTSPLTAANPALTSPTGAAPGGLTTPPVAGADPLLATTPISNGVGLPAPGEVGLEPAGTYPILGGDPGLGLGASSLGALPADTGSGGLLGNVDSAFQALGGEQAIDLLKGVVMPMITSAMKSAAPPVPAAVPVPPAPGA